jgi:uncharacterized membrane protein YbhN (UPF0104 family)
MMGKLWPWIRNFTGVAILGVLVWRLGTGAFVDGLRVITVWSVLAALGIGLLTTVFCAWRWCLVARRLGLELTLSAAVKDYYRALFLNAVLPAGVLGDVHRAVSHGQQSGDIGRGVRAVVLERVAGQVVLLVLGVAVLLTQPTLISAIAGDLVPSRTVVIVTMGVLAVFVGMIAWAKWGTSTSKWRSGLATTLTDARLSLRAPGVFLFSALALGGHLLLFVVAARVAGSDASIGQLLAPLVLALLVMGLPVNIGGFGPREAITTVAFGAAGLGATQGLTVSVVYGVLALAASLPGAAVLFLHRSVKQPVAPVEPVAPQRELVAASAGT